MKNTTKPPATVWEAIDTAPKHGGAFLAFNKTRSIHFYTIGHYYWDEKYEMGGFKFDPPIPGKPTHWAHLPTAPI